MEIQTWIIGQIVLDIIMAALLVWFILFQFRKNGTGFNFKAAFQKSESILSEMEHITQALEKNLMEKREISARILQRLDDTLEKADESRKQLQKLIREHSAGPVPQMDPLEDTHKTRELINTMLDKGIQKTEISHHLGISIGELDLLLKLKV